ncbi:MAG: hypothetical protein CL943_01340 [Candidatus Diapherotrites archaeon]|uniref:CDP-archaeol synthase n=1 Tax=Candidatus Iainarchaeum sp. TaxID=3101447 RepID=A0A2D6M0H9_9ARCH|nr:hypothetical protein [Candidatus Diapherotrites archaeon]|tara:strand:+ start:3001 stop:3525 length:525 start_codon:yes stop_codon:yes gene_type:complete
MIDYLIEFFAVVILVIIPIYLSNSLALVFGGKTPIDFNKNFSDDRPIFGPGKTIRGAIAGIFFGSLTGIIVSVFIPQLTGYLPVDYVQYAILLSVGAVVGDIAASFLKRRINIERGKSVLILDQLDFLIGGLVIGGIIFVPSILQIAFLTVFTFLMHRFANNIAFLTKLKKVPW